MTIKTNQASEVGEYDEPMLLLLQLLWGDGFLSPGGAAEVAELLEGSDITGCRVLDIGAALGAVDELLVTQHGAGHVTGIDIDPVMLNRMDERITRAGLRDRPRLGRRRVCDHRMDTAKVLVRSKVLRCESHFLREAAEVLSGRHPLDCLCKLFEGPPVVRLED